MKLVGALTVVGIWTVIALEVSPWGWIVVAFYAALAIFAVRQGLATDPFEPKPAVRWMPPVPSSAGEYGDYKYGDRWEAFIAGYLTASGHAGHDRTDMSLTQPASDAYREWLDLVKRGEAELARSRASL